MESGEFGTVRDLAIAVGLAERHVSRQLRVACLAPEVPKRLVYGRDGPAVTVLDLSDCAARRISFTTCSAGAFVGTGFFLISTSMWGQDEPQTLRYAITPNCSMSADGGQGGASRYAKRQAHWPQLTFSDSAVGSAGSCRQAMERPGRSQAKCL